MAAGCWKESVIPAGIKKGHPQRGGFLVGATGFEPATSSSRTKRATKLRYAPTMGREECGFSGSGQGEMRRFAVGIPDYGDERGEGLGSALQGSKGK